MIARRVQPCDKDSVLHLMSGARRTIVRMPWRELEHLVSDAGEPVFPDLFLGEVDGHLACVWGLTVEPETVAHIRVFGASDEQCLSQALDVLLAAVVPPLREHGVRILAFVGLEGWLVDALLTSGFRRVNTVVTMQKSDFAIPDAGNDQVSVRSVREDDLAAILAIEDAAFEPLWRNTAHSLAHYRATSPYFVVATLGEHVAGYVIGSLEGRHAHVTRIAVSPMDQSRRIGVRLLAEAIHFFCGQGVFGITLNTEQDNVKAHRLYRWFGFRALGREAGVLVRDLDVWRTPCQTDKS